MTDCEEPSQTHKNLIRFPPDENHDVESKYVAQTFKIQVMQPAQKKGDAERFPVVYVTDGNAVFDLFKDICRLIQATKSDAPRFILVAIGYPGDSPFAGNLLRGRDLTFPGCPNFTDGLSLLQQWEGVLAPRVGTTSFCGAEDFQRFLGEELIPWVDGKYATVPGARTYFGHSAGGGFGLFTLFTQSHLFRNYIVSSPNVVYDGKTHGGVHYHNNDFLLQRARDCIAAGKRLDGIQVYMSVGLEEEVDPLNANWQFTSGFYRMAALMRNTCIPGLTLMTEVFAGESHTTVWPIGFMHGVQAVFGTRLVSGGACPNATTDRLNHV